MKWPLIPLGDIAQFDRKGVSPEAIRSGTKYVGLENIAEGGELINVTSVNSGDLASSKFAFTRSHILYGKLRPYLRKIARPIFDGICSTDIVPVLPGPGMDRNYLTHFLRLSSSVSFAADRAVGVNLPRISPSILATLPVPVPNLQEQRRIAAILDQAEALRAKRRQALAKLDTLTQSLFLEMFEPRSGKATWPMVALADMITDGPQNGLYRPSSDYGDGTPILRIDGFYDGEITDIDSLKRLRLEASDVERYGLRENDLVINRVNSLAYLGKSALVPSLREPTVFESNMMRFALDSSRVDPVYAIAALQTKSVQTQIQSRAKNAVNQSSINQTDVRYLQIQLAPMSLQLKFKRCVAAIRAQIQKSNGAAAKTEGLFAALQELAFGGDL